MTAYNPPIYNFGNFNPAIYEQGSTYTLVSGGASLTGNNTWLGTNTFSNAAGVITNLVESITVTTLSLGTTLANAVSIGRTGLTTTINGLLTTVGILTASGGLRADNIDSTTNGGNINIGTLRSESTITIGGGVSNIRCITNILHPFRTDYIDSTYPTNIFYIGVDADNITLGKSNGGLFINPSVETFGGIVLSQTGTSNPWIDSTGSPLVINHTGNTTNILGNVTIGETNTINLETSGGLNRLSLSGDYGSSGYVLTSNGSGGSLSWAAGGGGGGVSLAGNNTWTGTNQFNGGLYLGTSEAVYTGTIVADSPTMNTIVDSASNQTVTLSKIGQTYFIYRSSNSPNIPNVTNTVLLTSTVTNTGIYTVCYTARYGSGNLATRAKGLQAWIYVSSPALYGGGGYGQLALNLVGYATPYLEVAAVGVCMTSSWTGLINAGADVQLQCFLEYAVNTDAVLLGGAGANYLSITRIA